MVSLGRIHANAESCGSGPQLSPGKNSVKDHLPIMRTSLFRSGSYDRDEETGLAKGDQVIVMVPSNPLYQQSGTVTGFSRGQHRYVKVYFATRDVEKRFLKTNVRAVNVKHPLATSSIDSSTSIPSPRVVATMVADRGFHGGELESWSLGELAEMLSALAAELRRREAIMPK